MVTDFQCHLTRRNNRTRPDGAARCERLELTVVAPGKEDLSLFEWYGDHTSMSGRILIELSSLSTNQNTEWKEVQFENGICYSMEEEYHIDQNRLRSLRLCIAVDQLTIDTVEFYN